MAFNDDEFDPFEFGADETGEGAMEDIRKEHERIRNLPIMRKAHQLLEITEALLETLPEDEIASHYRQVMLEDALILPPKIAAAEGADLYTLRMENAVLIKVAARNLLTQTSGLNMMGLSDPRYLQLLREEVEEFRKLFVAWVATFDRTKDIRDNWGLFYD
jgi:hypothetical protein